MKTSAQIVSWCRQGQAVVGPLAWLMTIGIGLSDLRADGGILVSNLADLNTAVATARPGDTIELRDGTWQDADILFRGNGTEDRPITLRAQTPGRVFLSGASRLRITGSHLAVEGLVFTNGFITFGDVIAFQDMPFSDATNCCLSHCAVINYNPPNSSTNTKWITLYGVSNRVENCYFRGKNNIGSTIVVAVSVQPDSPNYHRIARNYFGLRPDIGTSGETLRVGSSEVSLNLSRTVVENNLFERCNGEIEIISNKSCENVYRHNTFVECEGTLTLRHGNACIVEANYFLGRLRSRTGGVRVIGEDHKIFNNYFSELTGSDGRSALTFQQGVVDSPLNGYFQVKRALVAFNTFVRCQNNVLIGLSDTPAGSSQPGTLPPVDCVIANNALLGMSGPLIVQRIAPVNTTWEANMFFGASLGIATNGGLWLLNPDLVPGTDALWRPSSTSPALGAARGNYPDVVEDFEGQRRPGARDIGCDQASIEPAVYLPLTAADVGPDWLRSLSVPPSITAQPASQRVEVGATVRVTTAAAGTKPLGYRWWANGTAVVDGGGVSGATTATLTLSNVQFAQTSAYRVVVSNAQGIAVSSNALLIVTPLLPLAEALDNPEQVWTTGGPASWVGQSLVTHDGSDAARSGAIVRRQESWLQTTMVGPGRVSFWWKVSCETNKDGLHFAVDGTEAMLISGETDWQARTFNLGAGNHALRWTYAKNNDVDSGQDRAWLDQVEWLPPDLPSPPTITKEPFSQTVGEGGVAHFNVGANGTAPLLYQWRFNGLALANGVNVSGATGAVLTLSNIQPVRAGTYSIAVSNELGIVHSTNAVLRVTPTLSESVEAPCLSLSMAGFSSWIAQTNVAHDGIDAARSGFVDHDQSTRLEAWVNGPGTVSFWWKVSSEPVNDQLRFYAADLELARISGEVDWQFLSFRVPAGPRVLLKWRYSKNSDVTLGQDCAWVDEVSYVEDPAPPALDVGLSPAGLALSWRASPGKAYLLEYKDHLAEGTWKELLAFPSTNCPGTILETVKAGGPQRFYRVKER